MLDWYLGRRGFGNHRVHAFVVARQERFERRRRAEVVVSVEHLLELFTRLDCRVECGSWIELQHGREPLPQTRRQRLDVAIRRHGAGGNHGISDARGKFVAIQRAAQKQREGEHAHLQHVRPVIDDRQADRPRARNAKLPPVPVL